MASQVTLNLSCVLLAFMVICAPYTEGKVYCSDVKRRVNSCRNYVIGQGNVPPFNCCNDLRGLQRDTMRRPDRQETCLCLKQATSNLRGLIWSRAASLPRLCRIPNAARLPPISARADCSRAR